jgi:hypothetical protein
MIRMRIERLNALSYGDGGGKRNRRRQAVLAVDALEDTLHAIETRQAVLRAGRPGRTAAVLTMLARGDYAQFSGVRSALLDMVRK